MVEKSSSKSYHYACTNSVTENAPNSYTDDIMLLSSYDCLIETVPYFHQQTFLVQEDNLV